jgi:hypothetical protein
VNQTADRLATAHHGCEAITADLAADVAAANDYVAKHGSFADLAREHYRNKKADPD